MDRLGGDTLSGRYSVISRMDRERCGNKQQYANDECGYVTEHRLLKPCFKKNGRLTSIVTENGAVIDKAVVDKAFIDRAFIDRPVINRAVGHRALENRALTNRPLQTGSL